MCVLYFQNTCSHVQIALTVSDGFLILFLEASPEKAGCSTDEERKKEQEGVDTDTEDDAPPSPTDLSESIKQKFLVEMPQDFYDFWEFAKTIDSKNPTGKS